MIQPAFTTSTSRTSRRDPVESREGTFIEHFGGRFDETRPPNESTATGLSIRPVDMVDTSTEQKITVSPMNSIREQFRDLYRSIRALKSETRAGGPEPAIIGLEPVRI